MPQTPLPSSLPSVALDPQGTAPLHRQLYFSLRQAILDGRLRPGLRLPSTRALAEELGVSRNTVLSAFDQLTAEGYIEGRIGAGSFIPERLPEETLAARHPEMRQTDVVAPPGPSKRGAALTALGRPGGLRIPFAPGLPELERFPFEDWARLLGRRWRRPRHEFLVGTAPAGYGPLREAIADHLSSARAVACDADQVIVTSGTQQALDLATRVLIDPDDPVWIEEPGYPATAAALRAAGARLVPVPVDDEGLSIQAGKALGRDARLICVSPSHQYPLGVTMSLKRRLELLDWARAIDGILIEDDYDSEYRYAGRPLAALQGLDADGRVIYLGSLSKVMFPGLRLGYMVVPGHLVDAFLAVRALIDAYPSSIAQGALADFIGDGLLAAHIRRMRPLYAERQAALIKKARERFGSGTLDLRPAEAGMHLVARLDPSFDDVAIMRGAAQGGVATPALSTHYLGPPALRGLLLGYAGLDPKAMDGPLDRLATVLEERPCADQGMS